MNSSGIKEIARAMVDLAKENLVRDGHLTPAVGIISPHDTEWNVVLFGNPAEKCDAYRRVAARARRLKADAVICINDTMMKTVSSPEEVKKYRNGDLQKDPEACDAICVAVKCPGDTESLMYTCCYTKIKEQFVFTEVQEGKAVIGMVPDWWD